MKNIKSYNNFLILEKFDDNIKSELKKLGVTDDAEIRNYLYQSHRGNLGKYLQDNGKVFTFGLLKALFLDAQEAKKKTDIKVGIIKGSHRIIPMLLAPFFPIVAIIGYVLGTSRAFNKVIAPVLSEPGVDFPDFLNKLVTSTMKIAEGDIIPTKDRFTRAFVVSDNLIDALKEDVLRDFASYLSKKMSNEDKDSQVPDHYIENNLKQYLNKRFDVEPEIPLKENLKMKHIKLFEKFSSKLNESTYLGSCVEVGDEDSDNYINDIFSDATEMAYYVGDPDSGDIGRSEEIKKPVFLKNISLSSIDKKTLKGDVQFYYIPDLKIYYIYTDDGIHHFYES